MDISTVLRELARPATLQVPSIRPWRTTGTASATQGHLAACAGLAPVTRRTLLHQGHTPSMRDTGTCQILPAGDQASPLPKPADNASFQDE